MLFCHPQDGLHMVVCQGVVDLFPVPAAADQPGLLHKGIILPLQRQSCRTAVAGADGVVALQIVQAAQGAQAAQDTTTLSASHP